MAGSYPVLFVSLAAHAAQFAFLVFFENPREFLHEDGLGFVVKTWSLDIERFYGQRKPLAQRVPIRPPSLPTTSSTIPSQGQLPRPRAFFVPSSTPSATDGTTASESEADTETTFESQQKHAKVKAPPVSAPLQLERQYSPPLSHHDLQNKYFRRDTIFLFHFDVFRCAAGPLSVPRKTKTKTYSLQGPGSHAVPRDGVPVSDCHPPFVLAHKRRPALRARTRLDALPHARPRRRAEGTEFAQVPRGTFLEALPLPGARWEPRCAQGGVRQLESSVQSKHVYELRCVPHQ